MRHVDFVSDQDGHQPSDGRAAQAAASLRPLLERYFRTRVREHADIDDLVQEVFARMWAREGADPIDSPARYAYQIAASVLADRARRRQVRHADGHVEFNPETHAGQDIDPLRKLEAKERLRAATAALLTLPDRTRHIFVLHRLEGMKYREVSDQLGISVSAVEKHMMRAIQHLTASCGAEG